MGMYVYIYNMATTKMPPPKNITSGLKGIYSFTLGEVIASFQALQDRVG